MVDVSIIIVSWNTRDILRECIQSIYANAGHVQFEIIVVDNASTDGSPAMVEGSWPQVVVVKNAENRGFAAANNQGMKIACGRYFLLLNSDTVVLEDALAKAVAFADARPDAAVVGCRVLNADRSVQLTCFMYPSLLNMLLSSTYLYKLFPGSRFFGRERMTWWKRDDEREVQVVTGCFMLVRREAVEQVGVMDKGFYMYGEETDWCYRFRQAGWRVLFTPACEIIHYGGASSRQKPVEMALHLRASILRFLKKHRGWPTYLAARGLTALFFSLRIPYWLLRASVARQERRYYLSLAQRYSVCAYKSLLGIE